jgi:hemoglobin
MRLHLRGLVQLPATKNCIFMLLSLVALANQACASHASASPPVVAATPVEPEKRGEVEKAKNAERGAAIAPTQSTRVASTTDRTLFDRLGGLPAIEAVVSEFTQNVAADERVNARFGLADLATLKTHLRDFFCEATGGPCAYKGRPMKAAHQNMGITNVQFDAIVGNLVKSLDKLGVAEREKSEILSALGPMRKDIVEVE